jgi:hypothetical protein
MHEFQGKKHLISVEGARLTASIASLGRTAGYSSNQESRQADLMDCTAPTVLENTSPLRLLDLQGLGCETGAETVDIISMSPEEQKNRTAARSG